MKNHIYCLFLFIVISGLISCSREKLIPDTDNITRYICNLNIEESIITRGAVDHGTGVFSWTSGDQIAYCYGNSVSCDYSIADVDISGPSITESIPEGKTRKHYALYPASCAPSSPTLSEMSDHISVVYSTSYDYRGKNTSNVAMCPMVASNTGSSLNFSHVGGILHIFTGNLYSNVARIRITFTGMTNVTGKYDVSNVISSNGQASLVSGTGNVITVLVDSNDGALNIPMPSIDYSSLTGITVDYLDSSSDTPLYSVTRSVNYGILSRATGFSLSANIGINTSVKESLSSYTLGSNEFIDVGYINKNREHGVASSSEGDVIGSFYIQFASAYNPTTSRSAGKTIIKNLTTNQKWNFASGYYYINGVSTTMNTSASSSEPAIRHACLNSTSSNNNAIWVYPNASKGKHRWYSYSSNPIKEDIHYLIFGDNDGTSAPMIISCIQISIPVNNVEQTSYYYPIREDGNVYFQCFATGDRLYVRNRNTYTPVLSSVKRPDGYEFHHAGEEEADSRSFIRYKSSDDSLRIARAMVDSLSVIR